MELKALIETFSQEEAEKNRILQIQEDNADIRAALICAAIVNTFRTRKQPYKVSDFLPKKQKTEQAPQTPEQMVEQIKLWNASLGGK